MPLKKTTTVVETNDNGQNNGRSLSHEQIMAQARREERKRLKKQAKRKIARQFARPEGELSRGITELNLPYNEQVTLQSVVDSDPDVDSRKYVGNLVAPAYNMSRIPDSLPDATALVHSVKVLKIPVYFNDMGSFTGSFAFAVNPSLGALGEPSQYKVALVQPVTSAGGFNWPANLSTPSSFVSEVSGNDIRIDSHYQILTQPQLAKATYAGNGTGTTLNPFGGAIIDQEGYGLEVGYATNAPDGSQASFFAPPPGYYDVEITLADNVDVGDDLLMTVTPFGGTVLTNVYNTISPDDAVSVWYGTANIPASYNNVLDPAVTVATARPGFGVVVNNAASTISSPIIRFTRSYDDVPGISGNNGLIQKYRPTGCSVLASYVGPSLTNGGNIAAAFIPGSALRSQFFNSSATTNTGNISDWQNVSALSGAYNGPIKDGVYGWWSPTTVPDYSMFTPDEAAAYEYPSIIVAGQWAPGGDTSTLDGTSILRVEIHTNYEICTDTILLEKKHQKGTQAMMDNCLNHLVGQPHVMMNADHLTFMQKVMRDFKAAGNWIWKNKATLGRIVGTAATLL